MDNNGTRLLAAPVSDDDIIRDESFSFAGYQVVRGEFFAHINEPSISFNQCKIAANTACVNKLPDVEYVQILVNPRQRKLAVRPCREDERDSFLWSGMNRVNGRKKPRTITCRLFFAKIVQLMDWNPDYRYKMIGKLIQSNDERLFVFDLTATEIYQRVRDAGEKPRSVRAPVFPAEWQNQFGLPVEEHRKSLQVNIFDGYAVFGLKDMTQDEKDEAVTHPHGGNEGITNE